MTKLQVGTIIAAAAVAAVAFVVRTKRISPIGWGWYGRVETADGVAVHGYACRRTPVTYVPGLYPRAG